MLGVKFYYREVNDDQMGQIILNFEIIRQPRDMPWKLQGQDPTRTETQMSGIIEAWHKGNFCVWILNLRCNP